MNDVKSKVSIVFLAYNTLSKLGRKSLKLVIESILRQKYPNFMFVVVDNGSLDDTASYAKNLLSNYSHVDFHVIKLPRNYGYAGGNNAGAVYSILHGAEYLFFMNDDVVLLNENLITVLLKALEEDESLGAVQPLIMNRDGTLNCGFRCGLSSIPKMSNDGRGIFYVSGAALLTRAKTFLEVGMFDSDFFLYHDDVDYAWRLRLSGYKVKCVKSVRVYHIGSATLGVESPTYYRYMLRNVVWTLVKNSSMKTLTLRLALLVVESIISFLLHHLIIRRDPILAKAVVQGLFEGMASLKKATSKRALIQRARKVSEEDIDGAMSPEVDLELLIPRSVRQWLGKCAPRR